MKHHRKAYPTIGPSFEIDKGARLFFEKWLPALWLLRPQTPDVHIDYRVEVVENGEPTALNFLAQITAVPQRGNSGDGPLILLGFLRFPRKT